MTKSRVTKCFDFFFFFFLQIYGLKYVTDRLVVLQETKSLALTLHLIIKGRLCG